MQLFKKLTLGALLSLLLNACVNTAPQEIDEKYVFADLKPVTQIISHRIDSWNEIDKQSLFISTSPSTSYLIILRRPNNDIRFARKLSFRTTGNSLDAKFDRLYFFSPTDSIAPLPAYIDRIYEIKGKEQRKMIRAQILDEASDTET